MGRSRDDKAASHARIVEVAAARVREAGLEQPGVAEIMRAAGLTHGGFYKHFASRDDLVTAAVEHALTQSDGAAARIVAGADDPLAAFADWYVSAAHRDDPAHGCGIAALGTEMPRAPEPARRAYREQVERYLARLEELLGGDDDEARRRATVTLSAMVGAIVLARALGDTPRSGELLADVRAAVRERRLLA